MAGVRLKPDTGTLAQLQGIVTGLQPVTTLLAFSRDQLIPNTGNRRSAGIYPGNRSPVSVIIAGVPVTPSF